MSPRGAGRPYRPSQRRPVVESPERPELPAEARRALADARIACHDFDRTPLDTPEDAVEADWRMLEALQRAGFRWRP